MDVKEAIAARYSCRAYKPEDVDDALIRDCLECALLAPSACNKQPWKFYVVKGEKKAKIAKCTQLFGANGFTDGAPALIVRHRKAVRDRQGGGQDQELGFFRQ